VAVAVAVAVAGAVVETATAATTAEDGRRGFSSCSAPVLRLKNMYVWAL